MIELLRVGFFREMPHGEATDPSLADSRAASPAPHQETVAAYLDAGHVYVSASGFSRDVFDTSTRIGPPHCLTDGRYMWPGDLSHYVRTYNVRLPTTFIEHMLASGWKVPAEVDTRDLVRPAATGRTALASAPRLAEPAPTGSDDLDDDPAVSDLVAKVADFFGSTREALGGRHGDALRNQIDSLGAAAARLVEAVTPTDPATRERIATEAEAFRAAVEAAGADAARAAEALGDDLRRAFEDASARAKTRLSSTLRNLTDWLEQPAPSGTTPVQSLVSSLEAKLQELLAPDGKPDAKSDDPPRKPDGDPPHEN